MVDIFIAGCSTLAPAAIDTSSSISGGPAPGTAAADQDPNKTLATEINPKPAETENNSGAGQNPANKRVEKDEEYFIPPPLLPYDGIAPVYEPQFVTAAESPLVDDELVMGVSINGESKAYPVTVLRFREMVDDELGGLPILVTW